MADGVRLFQDVHDDDAVQERRHQLQTRRRVRRVDDRRTTGNDVIVAAKDPGTDLTDTWRIVNF